MLPPPNSPKYILKFWYTEISHSPSMFLHLIFLFFPPSGRQTLVNFMDSVYYFFPRFKGISKKGLTRIKIVSVATALRVEHTKLSLASGESLVAVIFCVSLFFSKNNKPNSLSGFMSFKIKDQEMFSHKVVKINGKNASQVRHITHWIFSILIDLLVL